VQNVNSNDIICNTGLRKSTQVVKIPAGAKVGAWWQHVIGGPQFAGDRDNPIAASHKGSLNASDYRVVELTTLSLRAHSCLPVCRSFQPVFGGRLIRLLGHQFPTPVTPTPLVSSGSRFLRMAWTPITNGGWTVFLPRMDGNTSPFRHAFLLASIS
jgi:hypothetical protein